MSSDERVERGSPLDLAIERAMREAQLRAGDADSTATVGMVENEAVGAVPDGVDGVDSD